MALIPALDLHKLYTVSQLHINKSHSCVRMIYTPTPQPSSLSPSHPPSCSLTPPHGSLSAAFLRLCTHTHARVSLEGCKGARKKRPRATCSVGERPLILSQREWACWGISAGLWVAQKDGGQGKGRQHGHSASQSGNRCPADTDGAAHFDLRKKKKKVGHHLW